MVHIYRNWYRRGYQIYKRVKRGRRFQFVHVWPEDAPSIVFWKLAEK